MAIVHYLVQSLKIASLSSDSINKIKEDKNATPYALWFFVLPILILRILDTLKYDWPLKTLIAKIIFEDVILSLALLAIIHLSARLVKSTEDFYKFFRVYGLSTWPVSLIFY